MEIFYFHRDKATGCLAPWQKGRECVWERGGGGGGGLRYDECYQQSMNQTISFVFFKPEYKFL